MTVSSMVAYEPALLVGCRLFEHASKVPLLLENPDEKLPHGRLQNGPAAHNESKPRRRRSVRAAAHNELKPRRRRSVRAPQSGDCVRAHRRLVGLIAVSQPLDLRRHRFDSCGGEQLNMVCRCIHQWMYVIPAADLYRHDSPATFASALELHPFFVRNLCAGPFLCHQQQ